MHRFLFSLLSLFISLSAVAQSGYRHISVRGGFSFPETFHAQATYEQPLDLDNSYTLFGEIGAKHFEASPPRGYYWDGGVGYQQTLTRFKNARLRLTSEVHAGAATKDFFFGVGIGFEYSYVFLNGMSLVVHQTNQVNFLHNDTFKNGLLIGVSVPF